MHRHAVPDVHRLALWADQLPTVGAKDVCRFRLLILARPCRSGFPRQTGRRLSESVALALKRQQLRAVYQPVQNGRAHGVVAQVFAPVLNNPVGGHHDGATQLVAPVHHSL